MEHPLGFQIGIRNGLNTANLLLAGVYNQTLLGTPRDVITLGGFGSASRAPWILQTFSQNTSIDQLTTPTPSGALPAVLLYDSLSPGPIPGYDHRNVFYISRNVNVVFSGNRSPIINIEDALAGGEEVWNFGYAFSGPSTTPFNSLTAWPDAATQELLYKKEDGEIRPLYGNGNAIPFTFSGDSDQMLTALESRSDTYVIQAGVISTTRKITSLNGAASSSRAWIANTNAETVQFAWATGAAVSIPTNTWAVVRAIAGNAFIVAKGNL